MCGIAGFTDHPQDRAAVLRAMTAKLYHRGPQQEGFYLDDQVAFGHRRLVIIAPDGGEQPRVDAASGNALVYNGEIFDFRRHLGAYRQQGLPLRDGCDTEALFATLTHFGIPGVLERLDGAFAFAWREGATGKIHLVVDRMGEKPLYYFCDGKSLIFASELGALRCHPAVRAQTVDPASLARALAFEYIPGNGTAIEGVRKLGPAQHLTFDRGEITLETYWRPSFQPNVDDGATEEDRLRRLEQLLDASIEARLIADVPIGVFLSGGVDSSLITALAARHAPGIKTFTVQSPYQSESSALAAQKVASKLDVAHKVIPLTNEDLFAALAVIEDKLDEPFSDSSLLPGYLVCQVAKKEITVALGGDGADELLGGHPFLRYQAGSPLLRALPSALATGLRSALAKAPLTSRARFRGDQWLRAAGEEPALHPFLWLSAFDPQALDSVISPLLREQLRGVDLLAPLRQLLPALADLSANERLQSLWIASYLPWDGAAKLDRTAMWNSFEIRAPFLARDLVDFCLTLPAKDRVRGGETKYLLKKLAARHVPAEVIYRPKEGFIPPLAEFLRGPLRKQVEERLLAPHHRLSSWFNRAAIEKLWRAHVEARADHRRALWGLYLAFGWAERNDVRV